MTPFTPDELLSLAHPISESMYLGIKQIIAERDAARADALALAAERNNWQSMYQDAMAERDEARARVAELEQAWRVINSTAPAAALKGDAK